MQEAETISDGSIRVLNGLRILIVEDEYLVAFALADDLEKAGAIVIGPASTVEDAFRLIEQNHLHAAVLDIKLQAQMVFPVADRLAGAGIPFLFITGFDDGVLPREHVRVPKCSKPSSMGEVTDLLVRLVGRGA